MTVIDKRGIPLTHTFGELNIGECFQNTNDRLCMKTAWDAIIAYDEQNDKWVSALMEDEDELIIPLKATLTIERKS